MNKTRTSVQALLAVAAVSTLSLQAVTVAPEFAGTYTATSLGSAPGVPPLYGGLTLLAGDNNSLLIGGDANEAPGAIYKIGVTRDVDGHITGFSGVASFYAEAPWIDGGLSYGPGGVLFYTGFPNNTVGQILPGSSTPDRIDDVGSIGVNSSVGGLAFVPAGHPGAGQFKIVSYNTGDWYTSTLTPDGSGTYDLGAAVHHGTIPGGPEGIAYVPIGSDLFANPSVLISEYAAGTVGVYETDINGNPVLGTRRDFLLDLGGAEGAFIDPVTGDFLFSTFGGGDQIIVVRGFVAPPPADLPEGGLTLAMLGLGAALCACRRPKA